MKSSVYIFVSLFLQLTLPPFGNIQSSGGQTLFRSYGRCFAEFLEEDSLVRLGLLDLTTCVGFEVRLYHN